MLSIGGKINSWERKWKGQLQDYFSKWSKENAIWAKYLTFATFSISAGNWIFGQYRVSGIKNFQWFKKNLYTSTTPPKILRNKRLSSTD